MSIEKAMAEIFDKIKPAKFSCCQITCDLIAEILRKHLPTEQPEPRGVDDKYCKDGKPHDIRPGQAYHYCINCEHFY